MVNIRTATKDDIPFVAGCKVDAFPDKRQSCCTCFLPRPRSSVLREALNAYGKCTQSQLDAIGIAEKGGTQLGCLQLGLHRIMGARQALLAEFGRYRVEPGECYVESVGVAAEARGKGVGKKLMDWAEELGCTLGCAKKRVCYYCLHRLLAYGAASRF